LFDMSSPSNAALPQGRTCKTHLVRRNRRAKTTGAHSLIRLLELPAVSKIVIKGLYVAPVIWATLAPAVSRRMVVENQPYLT